MYNDFIRLNKINRVIIIKLEKYNTLKKLLKNVLHNYIKEISYINGYKDFNTYYNISNHKISYNISENGSL